MPGDELQWYVTRTTTNDGIMVNTANVTKYNMIGLMLEVHNITSSDEGYYFCRTLRNGMLVPEPRAGVCLFVYSKSK